MSGNTTRVLAESFASLDKDCRKHCVVVLRATFDVADDGTCTLADTQTPFCYADTHYGDPDSTSVQCEADFAPIKPRAEVLLDAQAHAPTGRAEHLEVALLGPGIDKRALVTGERRWADGALGLTASRPRAFATLPLAWHLAFGGTDRSFADGRERSDPRNPIGRGFIANSNTTQTDGALMPCIEDPRAPVRSPHDRPGPLGFGPVPRFAAQRVRFAGTYDQNWMDNILPFLPPDFDNRYHQGAPADQQLERLTEGMTFGCFNMSPGGRFRVRLPQFSHPVRFMFDDRTAGATITADTLILRPHVSQIVLLGRASHVLPRKFTRLREITVGRRSGARAA